MTHLTVLENYLDALLKVENYVEKLGILVSARGEVKRLGLSLEPSAELYESVYKKDLDALFIHRPWGLDESKMPADMGVLSYHLAFDENLTLGYNLYLAEAISMVNTGVLGYKEARPIGMIGDLAALSHVQALALISDTFGGFEKSAPGKGPIHRVAVVGAMTKKLVFEAAARGAHLYVTGQWRAHAERAVKETGIGFVTVGHERSERWGLNLLGQLLEENFPDLKTFVL